MDVGSTPTVSSIKTQRLTIASFLVPNSPYHAGFQNFKRIYYFTNAINSTPLILKFSFGK
nr:MAG TPA: hypothetical protein [Caudoviricetes sp.]